MGRVRPYPSFTLGSGPRPLLFGLGLACPLWIGLAPFLSFWLGLAFTSFWVWPGQPRPEEPTATPRRKGQPLPKRRNCQPQSKGQPLSSFPPPSDINIIKKIVITMITTQNWPTPTQEKEGPTPYPRLGRPFTILILIMVVNQLQNIPSSPFGKGPASPFLYSCFEPGHLLRFFLTGLDLSILPLRRGLAFSSFGLGPWPTSTQEEEGPTLTERADQPKRRKGQPQLEGPTPTQRKKNQKGRITTLRKQKQK